MADETFETFVQRERARLHGERDAIVTQQQEREAKLEAINKELHAIEAYEAARAGKAVRTRQTAAQRAGGRRGSKREQLLQIIKKSPGGIGRGEILEKMGLKGNKSGE